MKKLLLSLLIGFTCISLYAQEETSYSSTFHSSIFQKDYALMFVDRDLGSFLMEIINVEDITNPVYLTFNRSDFQYFYNSLVKVKEKLVEWERIAKKNKVTDYEKEIDVDFPAAIIVYKEDGELISALTLLTPVFKANDWGYAVSFGGFGYSTDLDHCIKYLFSFNQYDLNNFLKEINPKRVENNLAKKSRTDSLFK